ncbi:MAG: hypothetical protein PUF50_00270 [Erysipelotrichaceae bacterium]|nr:hypothetical protein [Erysipelotrichaceae bacterium]
MEEKKKIKTIYSQRVAGLLMTKGFVLLGMDRNRNGSNKNVFYFNESETLLKELDNLTK